MKVLFLDIDGCLNSTRWFDQYTSKRALRLHRITRTGIADYKLDPVAIGRVNRVTRETGAVICVSSNWRLGNEKAWAETCWMLKYRGLEAEIIGRTPEIVPKSGIIIGKVDRGLEIQAWLDKHPEVKAFAIIDDFDDMAHLKHRLVQTKMATGLLDEHAEQLIKLLIE